MAVTSPPTPLGTALPDITLPDLDGTPVSLSDLRGASALVVVVACNHCPYVRLIESPLGVLADSFEGTGVEFAAICPNDVSAYPDDDVASLRAQASRAGWHFPYLVDADAAAAIALGAVCTPDFFVFAPDGRLAYRGAFDSATPGNGQRADGALLRNALTAILNGRDAAAPHRPAMGCGIKWPAGREPAMPQP